MRLRGKGKSNLQIYICIQQCLEDYFRSYFICYVYGTEQFGISNIPNDFILKGNESKQKLQNF